MFDFVAKITIVFYLPKVFAIFFDFFLFSLFRYVLERILFSLCIYVQNITIYYYLFSFVISFFCPVVVSFLESPAVIQSGFALQSIISFHAGNI